MSEIEWSVIECPDCTGSFKVPATLADSDSVACPACGAEVGASPNQAPPSDALDWEDDLLSGIDVDEPLPAPSSSSSSSSGSSEGRLPPVVKESVGLDLSNLVVRDSNQAFKKPALTPSAQSSENLSERKPDNLGKISNTSDEAYLPVDEAPRKRVTSSKVRQEIVGWDEDFEGGRETTRSTVASTFKLVLVALPLLIGAAIFAINAKSKRLPRVEPIIDLSSVVVPEDASPKPVSPEDVTPLLDELGRDDFYALVVTAIENFMGAENYTERVKYARRPDDVLPLMERYYQSNPDGPIAYRSITKKSNVNVRKSFTIAGITSDDYITSPVVLSRSGDRLVIDWESFVGYSEMTFEEFREKRPTEPVLFRVRVRPDNYFNYGFDEKTHFCLKIGNLDLSERLYGYVPRRSDLAIKIETSMAKNNGIDFVIVKLRYPNNPQSDNQVIIEELLANGWLVGNEEE